MPTDQLKSIVGENLSAGSICALATGTGDYVRCTPLEYNYHDGKFWIFTGYVNYFSHIIKFKVHPSVKDTFQSPEPAVAMLSGAANAVADQRPRATLVCPVPPALRRGLPLLSFSRLRLSGL